MCRVGLREKEKSLGSGQERFMFCFNTPGLIKKKKISSFVSINTAGNYFDVPLQTQQGNVQMSG